MVHSISRFCLVELIQSRPFVFRISFDRTGNGCFTALQTQNVQLAARHCVGDLCEMRNGNDSSWTITEIDNAILMETKTFDRFRESILVKASDLSPEVDIEYSLEFLKDFEAHEIGTLCIRPDTSPGVPVVYLAGRQGVCPLQETVQHEVLVDTKVPISGWILKNQVGRSCWMTSEDAVYSIADWTRGEDRTWTGLSASVVSGWQYANYPATQSAWPKPARFTAGNRLAFKAHVTNGYLGDADTKHLLISGNADILRDEQEFIYAVSILGTFRPYTEKGVWFNRTAIGIHHFYARFYDWSWIRDNAHGYMGAVMMAGSAVQEAFADEIDHWIKAPQNIHGNWPHNNGLAFYEKGDLWKSAWADNLDTPAQLIEMLFLYASQTGNMAFILDRKADILRAADNMIGIVERNPTGRKLPWINEHGDTYMDAGFIRGEQTYLTAVFYRGFCKLAVLTDILGLTEKKEFFFKLAEQIRIQANLSFEKGGLWDDASGCYIGWRDMSGAMQPAGGHETYGNLLALGCGLCSEPARYASVLAWLDRNWKTLYEKNACPMTHSEVPYTQIEDGQTHSAPWICGWDLIARYSSLHPERETVWNIYRRNFHETDYPYLEGSYYKSIEVRSNRGRIWDSWGYLMGIWGIHLGLSLNPAHVSIHPSILIESVLSTQAAYYWQDCRYDILISGTGSRTQRIMVNDKLWPAIILPAFSCRIEVQTGEDASIPMIVKMDPLLSLTALQWDADGQALSGEIRLLPLEEMNTVYPLSNPAFEQSSAPDSLHAPADGKRSMQLWLGNGEQIRQLYFEGASDEKVCCGNQICFQPQQANIRFTITFYI